MQVNKHGIPIATNRKSIKKQFEQDLHNLLERREYAEFIGKEGHVEVTIAIANQRPFVQAMLQDGWILQKYSRGEIA